jgi:hypothetical protein
MTHRSRERHVTLDIAVEEDSPKRLMVKATVVSDWIRVALATSGLGLVLLGPAVAGVGAVLGAIPLLVGGGLATLSGFGAVRYVGSKLPPALLRAGRRETIEVEWTAGRHEGDSQVRIDARRIPAADVTGVLLLGHRIMRGARAWSLELVTHAETLRCLPPFVGARETIHPVGVALARRVDCELQET